MRKVEITIKENSSDRLDLYLSRVLDDISRTEIKKLIKEGQILVNNKKVKPKYLLKIRDQILVELPQAKSEEILAQNIPLNIIYEDSDLAIIDKPQNMVVHPAPGNPDDTLVNALLYHFESLSDIAGEIRPGIIHRLDKDTSGLLIIAKNNFSHKALSKSLKERNIKREYLALVKGSIKEKEGFIDEPIGRNPKNRKKMAVVYKNSKSAVTYYKVLRRFDKYTLVRVRLETGRTHQIRVHFAYKKHPVVGDMIYSNKDEFNLKGQLLHSVCVGFVHPRSGEYMEFNSELPKRFEDIIKKLK